MQLKKYAFLVKHKSYSPDRQNTIMESDEFSTRFIGVSSTDDAIAAIKGLEKEGIQLVELCGGFTIEDKELIKAEIKIPIGLVELDEEDLKLLNS